MGRSVLHMSVSILVHEHHLSRWFPVFSDDYMLPRLAENNHGCGVHRLRYISLNMSVAVPYI
jgi:hypothetical protein